MDKAVEALPRPWGRGQGRGSVAKDVGAWPRPWGVAKTVSASPNPNPKAVGA